MINPTDVLRLAKERAASDVVFVADATPFMRVEGQWLPIGNQKLHAGECERLVLAMVPQERHETLVNERELNFSREIGSFGRLRFNVHFQRDTLAATLRLIWPKVRSVDELQLPTEFVALALRHQGLILVSGAAGSGKSTTLAAIIQHILANRRAHVITIEDPIEYVHENGIGIVEQRELQTDTLSWHHALKNVLRQSPDVIVIGELQDHKSIATAVSAAETGHLVLASLHGHDSVQAINRIIDVFPGDQQGQIRAQVASSLVAVLAQQLVPSERQSGRVLATELMVVNPAIRNLIRTADYIQIHNSILSGRDLGMHTMQDSLGKLLDRQLISNDEMLHRLNDSRLARAAAS